MSAKVDRYTSELRARKGTTFTDLEFFAEHAVFELQAELAALQVWQGYAREQMSAAALREVDRRYIARNCKGLP